MRFSARFLSCACVYNNLLTKVSVETAENRPDRLKEVQVRKKRKNRTVPQKGCREIIGERNQRTLMPTAVLADAGSFREWKIQKMKKEKKSEAVAVRFDSTGSVCVVCGAETNPTLQQHFHLHNQQHTTHNTQHTTHNTQHTTHTLRPPIVASSRSMPMISPSIHLSMGSSINLAV